MIVVGAGLAGAGEADRLDNTKDELVVRIADPEMEADEKDAAIRSLGEQIERLEDGR